MYMMYHVYDKDVILFSYKDVEDDQWKYEDKPRKYERDKIHG